MAALALTALLLLRLWAEWVQVALNARGSRVGPTYSLIDVPMLLVPVVAALTTSRSGDAGGSSKLLLATKAHPARTLVARVDGSWKH